jgi:hypothetical protein
MTQPHSTQAPFWKIAHFIFSLLTLAILLGAGYWNMFRLPRFPFQYYLESGVIWDVHPLTSNILFIGDVILSVEGVPYAQFSQVYQPELIKVANHTTKLMVTIQRNGTIINHVVPLFTPKPNEFGWWWRQEWLLGVFLFFLVFAFQLKTRKIDPAIVAMLAYCYLCIWVWATGVQISFWNIPYLSTIYPIAKFFLPFSFLWACVLIPKPIMPSKMIWLWGTGIVGSVFPIQWLLSRFGISIPLMGIATMLSIVGFILILIRRYRKQERAINGWRVALTIGIIFFPIVFFIFILLWGAFTYQIAPVILLLNFWC